MFDNLIQAANKYGAADPVNLAETLWLALHMGALADKPAEAADPVTNKQPKSETVPLPELPDEEAEESDNRLQPSDQGKSPLRAGDPNNHGSDNNNSKWIGALPSLPNKPRFRQALRAFASHSPRHNNIIDETETAETYAQQGGLWLQPVLEKGMRRWLKVCLVVETGGSNALWAQPLAELEQVLRLRGVFREVSRKTLGPEAAHYQWWKDEIVIVASDFTSDGWWNGEYPNLLRAWASTQPLVCMHTLPARLWRRSWTSKPDAMACAQRPAQETRGWQITLAATTFEFEKPPSRFALPLMEMDADSMGTCANALMQSSGARTPAIVLATRESVPFEQAHTNVQRSAEQIVMVFKGAASPLARKLAQYLAVTAPLNFPVMRWVRQAMLPESDASHLAEFFLGGLLERISGDENTPADEVLYDFVDGVRELLRQGLRISHGHQVLETVGQYLEVSKNASQIWRSLVNQNEYEQIDTRSLQLHAFALVSRDFLQRIGLKDESKKYESLIITKKTSEATKSTFRENIDPRRSKLFGRDGLLKECAQKLQQKSVLLLYGMRGNGKSALLDALDALPPLAGKTRLRMQALPDITASDIFRALAWSLGALAEFPQVPQGDAKTIAAELLKRYPQLAKPVYLQLDRAHVLLKGQGWRDMAVRQLLLGLQLAYGAQLPLVLELRERPGPGLLGPVAHEVEVPGLDRNSMGEMLAANAPEGAEWHYQGDELKRLYGWIGAGNGKTAHPLTLTLLMEVARGLRQTPKNVLARHSDALEEKIEEKLLRDLFGNVLSDIEQATIETLALYRRQIPHDHADWLEAKLNLAGGWDSLYRRCLLASDAKGTEYYLHGFIAAWLRKRQGYAVQEDDGTDVSTFATGTDERQQALVRRRQMAIAECWLQQLGQGKRRTQLNIERALEAFHHLLAAGAGDRVQEVAVDLLSGKLDWALKKIQGFYQHLFQSNAPIAEQAKALEYWLALAPQESKAWRFLGECHVKLKGWGSAKALECFERACTLLPSFPQYWANLGRAMRAHGPDSARAFLHKLEQVEREHPEAINNHVQAVRADCEKTIGNTTAAREIRQKIFTSGKADAAIYAEEARALWAEGQPQAALALLQQAKQLGCDNDVTRAIEADLLQATGRGQEAQALRMAQIEAGSTNPVHYNDAAHARLQAGDASGALAVLAQAAARGVGDDFTEATRANALEQAGQSEAAMALRQGKIDAGSRHPVFYNDQANSHYRLGNYQQGLAVLDALAEQGGGDEVTAHVRAKILRKQGN